LIDELERSGLRGRGGAWFPTAVKWRAVASHRLRRKVVVANGAEGEPASRKDQLLLTRAPHLVLDGAALAAAAVGADRVVIFVPGRVAHAMATAVADRSRQRLDPVEPEVVVAADRFVAGEASAAVAQLNGGSGGKPYYTGIRPVHERGVGGQPTLIQNVETLAHAALIARFGAAWFRSMGTRDSPGTALASVSGALAAPRITEVALGTRLRDVVDLFDIPPQSLGGVLLGGYGCAWLPVQKAMQTPLCEEGLRPLGATFGAGVIALLPLTSCPLAETARLLEYMATQSAGQCGPCVNGLPALTAAMAGLAFDPRARGRRAPERLAQLCDLVDGRGACHHPDGVAKLVRSALGTFASHVDDHQRRGPCPEANAPPVLPLPDARRVQPIMRPKAR
jgi:NADH:ubiquinone oxidoreductase subunit F (NADH-binding)